MACRVLEHLSCRGKFCLDNLRGCLWSEWAGKRSAIQCVKISQQVDSERLDQPSAWRKPWSSLLRREGQRMSYGVTYWPGPPFLTRCRNIAWRCLRSVGYDCTQMHGSILLPPQDILCPCYPFCQWKLFHIKCHSWKFAKPYNLPGRLTGVA